MVEKIAVASKVNVLGGTTLSDGTDVAAKAVAAVGYDYDENAESELLVLVGDGLDALDAEMKLGWNYS